MVNDKSNLKDQYDNNYVVVALRHFDKTYGNTYHSVRVLNVKKHKTYYLSDIYGYGSQYLESAKQLIKDNENKDVKLNNLNVLSIVDVNTKKELKQL